MLIRLSVLDDIHVELDQANLAWDATSLDGEHVNEVHVNAPVDPLESLILQVDTLPDSKAADYVDHITRSILRMSLKRVVHIKEQIQG
ncbi:hypothetical protein SNE40_018729 [Patella caerulea]|uniref:Uncharacterized protein n=1 Tax=Patella caerulea TaxID=87958 RepID=A0AAN8J5F3_PATCE